MQQQQQQGDAGKVYMHTLTGLYYILQQLKTNAVTPRQ